MGEWPKAGGAGPERAGFAAASWERLSGPSFPGSEVQSRRAEQHARPKIAGQGLGAPKPSATSLPYSPTHQPAATTGPRETPSPRPFTGHLPPRPFPRARQPAGREVSQSQAQETLPGVTAEALYGDGG